jgi:hypothetical protein
LIEAASEELAELNPEVIVSNLPAIEELLLVKDTFVEVIVLASDELALFIDVPSVVTVAASEDDVLVTVPYIELIYAADDAEF